MTPLRPVLRRFGYWYVDRRVRRSLDGVVVSGLSHLRAATREGPVVVACTHQSWWDGLVAIWLTRQLGLHNRLMMRADNLEKWRFFEMFGAMGVDGMRGVRACVKHLQGPGDVLWTFPQGEYRRVRTAPLGLRRGATWGAEQAGCAVVPIALGYRLLDRPEVRAHLAIGPALLPGDPDALEDALVEGLARIEALEGFEPLTLPVAVEPGLADRSLAWLWRST